MVCEMKTFLISDNVDTATGMRLAGVEGVVVHGKEEFGEALSKAVKDKDVGIIFVTELLSDMYPDVVMETKERLKEKLLLEIPDRHGSKRRGDFITSYINEAIGVKL